MRVLVTGGGGFIGSALVGALSLRDHIVFAIDRSFPGFLFKEAEDKKNLSLIESDITDPYSVYRIIDECKPDAIIHCAAVVGVLASLSPRNMIDVNINGSLTLMEACCLYKVPRFIHISSEEVLGNFSTFPATETASTEPKMPYGITKLAVELLGRSYKDLFGLDFLNVRTSWVYGPGLPRNRVPRNLVEAAVQGLSLHIPYGSASAIDHTYIDDAVDGITRVLEKDTHEFDIYNISSGEAPTIQEIVDLIKSYVSDADISVGSGPLRHREDVPMVTKGSLDISRARDYLGYVPKYNIEKGIASYLAYFDKTKNKD